MELLGCPSHLIILHIVGHIGAQQQPGSVNPDENVHALWRLRCKC